MRKPLSIALIISIWMFLPGAETQVKSMEELKNEIIEVEKRFAGMAAEKGVGPAFLHFADDDAVIMRNNRVYRGKDKIGKYFASSELTDIQLKWKPDFVEVSSSGDLAYTYGKFTFSAKDKAGKMLKSTGIFHTVWKRQSDGSWKYVWD